MTEGHLCIGVPFFCVVLFRVQLWPGRFAACCNGMVMGEPAASATVAAWSRFPPATRRT